MLGATVDLDIDIDRINHSVFRLGVGYLRGTKLFFCIFINPRR